VSVEPSGLVYAYSPAASVWLAQLLIVYLAKTCHAETYIIDYVNDIHCEQEMCFLIKYIQVGGFKKQ
jgi:hypothetical protein